MVCHMTVPAESSTLCAAIAAMLQDCGVVNLQELADWFGVDATTIQSALETLQQTGNMEIIRPCPPAAARQADLVYCRWREKSDEACLWEQVLEEEQYVCRRCRAVLHKSWDIPETI